VQTKGVLEESSMTKLRVGLIFGGRSVEHEVSVISATSICAALDRARIDVYLIGVDASGTWHLGTAEDRPQDVFARPSVSFPPNAGNRCVYPYATSEAKTGNAQGALAQFDVLFPIVHGTGGEDGSLQGLFELTGIPYVGSGVLGSAIQMDKDITKRLLQTQGIPVVPWHCVASHQLEREGPRLAQKALDDLGLPLFVKPARLGSSVGIARVERAEDLLPALEDAARYDTKLLIEQGVDAREIEVAILGGNEPEASIPGEIRPKHVFYDYAAKYEDDSTELLVPAHLSEEECHEVKELAKRAYGVLEAWGLARVDFLLDRKTKTFFLNEVNSLPGFTKISMYPKLWEASGLPYAQLLNRLIDLALERARIQERLEFARPSTAAKS